MYRAVCLVAERGNARYRLMGKRKGMMVWTSTERDRDRHDHLQPQSRSDEDRPDGLSG
ncbi:uncharacterized protein BDW47DRAFT_106996 [Aspergillus candidus]|uniref:Uncharacterized protein n=1 Tax=Aspergillus candidus TaxID=41067 RepID=A0A2I2F9V8_ASPCN|nr:hypothetical protein BDW47DRAFT_106996 [Aspergillus candidus]PLB37411.1 hypothetical protein BDW47DRAFT_106996 [Aspergillus candidus]